MIMDEDIYDYIVVNIPIVSKIFENNPDVCIQQVDEQWIIMHSRLSENRELNISSLGYYTIPKIYGLMELSVLVEKKNEGGGPGLSPSFFYLDDEFCLLYIDNFPMPSYN